MNIKRCGWLLLAVLFFSPAVNGEAETCFTPLYYAAMFEPVALPAEAGGNPNLVAESDVLAATGKDPHDTGNGCMCGVNNGRFDLILRNAGTIGSDRAPVSFRILSLRIAFQDEKGTVSKRAVRMEGAQIDNCFGTPMPLEAYRTYDDSRGQAQTPRILEPGEGIIGCVCLPAADRARTGKARIEVAYEPILPGTDSEAAGTEASASGAAFTAAGPPAVRVFQAHMLSVGGGGEGNKAPPISEASPCCSEGQ